MGRMKALAAEVAPDLGCEELDQLREIVVGLAAHNVPTETRAGRGIFCGLCLTRMAYGAFGPEHPESNRCPWVAGRAYVDGDR